MARDQAPLWLAALAWEDAYAAVPKHRRLYQAFKSALLAGKVPTGTLWPSSRRLATLLHVSRGTVVLALEQLVAEGYLDTRPGSGTRVAQNLRPSAPDARAAKAAGPADPTAPRTAHPFAVGVPAVGLARLVAASWRERDQPAPLPLDEFGDPGLPEALTDYLYRTRRPNPARAHHDRERRPARPVRRSPRAHAAGPDGAGGEPRIPRGAGRLPGRGRPPDSDSGRRRGSCLDGRPRGASADPRHAVAPVPPGVHDEHWPPSGAAGVRGSARHLYPGRRLRQRPSLHGMDSVGRVLYLGTFSKVLAPTLRLGYLVLPPPLVAAFRAWRRATDQALRFPSRLAWPLSWPTATSSATSPECAASIGCAATRSWRPCPTPRGALLRRDFTWSPIAPGAPASRGSPSPSTIWLGPSVWDWFWGTPPSTPRRLPTPANAWPTCRPRHIPSRRVAPARAHEAPPCGPSLRGQAPRGAKTDGPARGQTRTRRDGDGQERVGLPLSAVTPRPCPWGHDVTVIDPTRGATGLGTSRSTTT